VSVHKQPAIRPTIRPTIRDEFARPVEQMAAKLLPLIAKRKMAGEIPFNAGASFFYEIDAGWETDMLLHDPAAQSVRNIMELEKAFDDRAVKTILIPYYASLTRAAALRVCQRHNQAKTVFFEVKDYE